MKIKRSNRDIVTQYILDNENREIELNQISIDTGVKKNRVGDILFRLSMDSNELVKVRRGVWIYKPTEKVKMEKPPKLRVLEAIEQGGSLTTAEIAKIANVDQSMVSELVSAAKRAYRVNIERTLSYKIS